jgi:uncharacterized repeat protein (TIGR02543 family)
MKAIKNYLLLYSFFFLATATAGAQGVVAGGTTGACTWVLTGAATNYTLTISGTGAMENYAFNGSGNTTAPWNSYHSDITTLLIGQGVTHIGHCAFSYSRTLKSVTFPNGLKTIGDNAFHTCTSLVSVILPEGLTNIGRAAFYDCISLESVTFPESLTNINDYAFQNCNAIKSVTFPKELETIGYCAFYMTHELISVTSLSLTPPTIDFGNFEGSGPKTIYVTVPSSAVATYQGWGNNNTNTIIIKDGGILLSVKSSNPDMGSVSGTASGLYPSGTSVSITATPSAGYSFTEWTNSSGTVVSINNPYTFVLREDVTLHAKWEERVVASGTTGDCTWKITGSAGNYTLTISGQGAMDDYFSASGQPWYSYRSGIKTLRIEPGVTHIGDYAFSECMALASVTLPAGLTSIGNSAFYKCSRLASVTLPRGLTSIGKEAFAYSGLDGTLTFPEGFTSIGEGAFECCNSLDAVILPAGLTSISTYAFFRCTSLKSVTFPEGLTSIGYLAFAYNGLDGTLTFPEGLTSIGEGAFECCDNLDAVILPAGLTSLSIYAFYGCQSLTSVTFPDRLTSIGEYAFCFCPSLNSVTILSLTPPDFDTYSLPYNSNFVLTVPTSAAAAYAGWGQKGDNVVTANVSGGGILLSVNNSNFAMGRVSGSGLYPSGSSVSITATPSAGYSFTGWATSSGAVVSTNNPYNFVLREDITLTAQWKKDIYYTVTVFFNSNGGSSVNPQIVPANGKAKKPELDPTRAHYSFVGWYADEKLSVPWYFDYMSVSSDITLHAKWQVDAHRVRFATGGGSSILEQTVDYGSPASDPGNPTKAGYKLVGWYADSGTFSSGWDFTASTVTQDTVLYAKWEIETYSITYKNLAGANNIYNAISYTVERSVPLQDIAKADYKFAGWYADSIAAQTPLT